MIHKQCVYGSMHNKNKSLFDARWCSVIRLNVLLCLVYVLRKKRECSLSEWNDQSGQERGREKKNSTNKIKSDTCAHRQFVENPKLGINGYYFTQVLILHSIHSYLSITAFVFIYDIGVVCLVKAFKLSDPIGNRTFPSIRPTQISIQFCS